MKPTKALAKKIAQRKSLPRSWSALRDLVDQVTGGDLDGFQLDLLTDWVDEIRKARRAGR